MSATVRALVDEAYDRRRSTWTAALETVNDWVESASGNLSHLPGARVQVTTGRIKDPQRTGEKLRRKLADSDDVIHEAVEVENQVIDIVGARAVCRTEADQSALWTTLQEGSETLGLSIAEVRDYAAHPKPSGYRGRHLIIEVPFDSEPSVLVELQIRTMLQDTWCQLSEEQLYKPDQPLTSDIHQERLAMILSQLLAQADAVAGHIAEDIESQFTGVAESRRPPGGDGSGGSARTAPSPTAAASRADDRSGTAAGPTGATGDPDQDTESNGTPASNSATSNPQAPASSGVSIEVTVRELMHSYALAADDAGRHGIIRFDSLAMLPGNSDGSAFPAPGDKLRVLTDETHTTRYYIPIADAL